MLLANRRKRFEALPWPRTGRPLFWFGADDFGILELPRTASAGRFRSAQLSATRADPKKRRNSHPFNRVAKLRTPCSGFVFTRRHVIASDSIHSSVS
jgi:hypothetical protein